MAIENDPGNTKILEALTELHTERKNWPALEATYRKALARLPDATPKATFVRIRTQLGDLYANHLNNDAEAIVAYEAAHELDPTHELSERLADLYLTDTKRYWDKAVRVQRSLLVKSPQHAQYYSVLRQLYTSAKKPDEAWCYCQALTAQKAAEPEEENFFKKFRSDSPTVAAEKLNDELWARCVVHPQQDALLTGIFACILPAVLAVRADKMQTYGVTGNDQLEAATDPGQMPRMLHYAAGVLALPTPPVFAKPSEESGIGFMHVGSPSLVLGSAALAGGPSQPLAFLAGNKISYFRAGHYMRQLVPTGTGLRSWLFAAIRFVNPTFPVTADLAGAVAENVTTLKTHLAGSSVELLQSLASKLINNAASLDLKRWTIGVDLTADRAGFLLANDLGRSLAVVRVTPDDVSPVPQKDRIRELLVFSTSDEYFHLRQRLGMAIQPAG